MDQRFQRFGLWVGCGAVAVATACGGNDTTVTAQDDSGTEAGAEDAAADALDSAKAPDTTVDTGTGTEAGTADVGAADAATSEAATDSGTTNTDTGVADTSLPDTSLPDAGAPDTAVPDSGTVDTGLLDAGLPDTSTIDTGLLDGGGTDVLVGDSAVDSSDAAAGHLVYYTFDTDPQGWYLNNYTDGHNIDGLDSGISPTFGWNSTDGNPAAGSLGVTTPFTGFNQYADIQVGAFSSPIDLTGKTLHANVRLVSGVFASGYAVIHADSTGYVFDAHGYVDASAFAPGVWVPLSFDLSQSTNASFDRTAIIVIGIQIGTGAGPADGGVYLGNAGAPPVFEIDTVTD